MTSRGVKRVFSAGIKLGNCVAMAVLKVAASSSVVVVTIFEVTVGDSKADLKE